LQHAVELVGDRGIERLGAFLAVMSVTVQHGACRVALVRSAAAAARRRPRIHIGSLWPWNVRADDRRRGCCVRRAGRRARETLNSSSGPAVFTANVPTEQPLRVGDRTGRDELGLGEAQQLDGGRGCSRRLTPSASQNQHGHCRWRRCVALSDRAARPTRLVGSPHVTGRPLCRRKNRERRETVQTADRPRLRTLITSKTPERRHEASQYRDGSERPAWSSRPR